MSTFWKNWLTLWCLGAGMFGLILYGAGFASTTAPTAMIFDLFGNPLPDQPDRYLRFAISLMGAVTLGWMITFYTLCRAAWSLDDAAARPLWRGAALSLGVWYVIDSYASIATGFPLNAVSNTVLAGAILWPIVATGKLRGAA